MKPEREDQLLREIERTPTGPEEQFRRWAAIRALGASKSERAFTTLVRLFTEQSEAGDRREALNSLIRTRNPHATPHIIAALEDADSSVRWDAAAVVGERRIYEGAEVLLKGLGHEDPLVRASCAEALGKLRHAAAVPALAAATRDQDSAVSSAATRALSEIATREANEALLADHIEVYLIWPHLIRLGDRRALPKMREWLQRGGSDRADQREWAIACGEPSLEKIARDWAQRWGKVRPKQKPARWGEGFDRNEISAKGAIADAETRAALEASGWFNDVPAREVQRITRALRDDEQQQGPVLLAPAGYDAECIENSGDYKRWVLPAYQKASFGEIKFTKVKDVVDHDNEVATISFVVGDKPFSAKFRQTDDFVADGFHAFMNKVAAALGQKKRFYMLETGDQTVALAFVTAKTYARARKARII